MDWTFADCLRCEALGMALLTAPARRTPVHAGSGLYSCGELAMPRSSALRKCSGWARGIRNGLFGGGKARRDPTSIMTRSPPSLPCISVWWLTVNYSLPTNCHSGKSNLIACLLPYIEYWRVGTRNAAGGYRRLRRPKGWKCGITRAAFAPRKQAAPGPPTTSHRSLVRGLAQL